MGAADGARLFVALQLGAEDRTALTGWARGAVGADPELRLVDEGQVHLTMAFLGHRAPEEIGPLAGVVESFAGTPAPRLATAGALWLSPRRPHVLTVAVADPGGGLGVLHDALWTRLEELGHERERRPFRPHLTVARVRHGRTAPQRALPPVPERSPVPVELALVRSWPGSGGRRHEVQARARFSAGS